MKKVIGPLLAAVALSGCATHNSEQPWWKFWGSSAQTAAKAEEKKTQEPKLDVSKQWLDVQEPKLRAVLQDSDWQIEREQQLLRVSLPVDSNFNPDRPQMLMPRSLSPLTKVAKLSEQDAQMAVLVLGHGDASGPLEATRELSQQRAQAISSIFSMGGLHRDRLLYKGVGSDMPRASNENQQGRAFNRRIEILIMPKSALNPLLAKYFVPQAAQAKTAVAQSAATAAKPALTVAQPAKQTAKAVAKAPAKTPAKTPAKQPAKTVAKKAQPRAKNATPSKSAPAVAANQGQ